MPPAAAISTTAELTVLVVEADRRWRDQIVAWIEGARMSAMACPGPLAPDYTCLGGRGGRCALAAGADVVVLDIWTKGDEILEGTSGWELLTYYRAQGLPVIPVRIGNAWAETRSSEDIVDLRHDPAGHELVGAIRSLVGPSSPGRQARRDRAGRPRFPRQR